MRVEVEVRLRTTEAPESVWSRVCDPTTWPPMPGADLTYLVRETDAPRLLRYSLATGLPVRDHDGVVHLEPSGTGGTEIVVHEAFRARLWGTSGYLRGRRERALVDLTRAWSGS